MNDILLKILLWGGLLVAVLLIVRKPLVRWINKKTKELTNLPPIYISPEVKESLNRGTRGYIAPEVYTAPTFRIPELLKLVRNPNYPQRTTALEYIRQYFTKDYSRVNKEFEQTAIEMIADPAIRLKITEVLDLYCTKFNRRGLRKKAEKRRQKVEQVEVAEKAREAEISASYNSPENQPNRILLMLGNAMTEGRRVEIRGVEIKTIEACINSVFKADVGEEVEVGIETDGKMVRQNLVFRLV